MRFGVREICDVVMRAKSAQKIGNKIFYKHEPVIYFDSLKTTSLEGGSTTVYAQGGRGNARLIAWEGERTLTFTMEDALLSPISFMILSGAGLIEATTNRTLKQHIVEYTDDVTVTKTGSDVTSITIEVEQKPYPGTNSKDTEQYVYVMLTDQDGQVSTEPYYAKVKGTWDSTDAIFTHDQNSTTKKYQLIITGSGDNAIGGYTPKDLNNFMNGVSVVVDYYTERASDTQQIEITPDSFGGNFYLEASTLFRDTNGVDLPAEFIIPNCKVQSNFTFTMASSGDPSTFTFTMDAFPGYTRFDTTKKVLAAIQIVTAQNTADELLKREETPHEAGDDIYFPEG